MCDVQEVRFFWSCNIQSCFWIKIKWKCPFVFSFTIRFPHGKILCLSAILFICRTCSWQAGSSGTAGHGDKTNTDLICNFQDQLQRRPLLLKGYLGIRRVKYGFNQQDVRSSVHQASGLLRVGLHEFIKRCGDITPKALTTTADIRHFYCRGNFSS